MKKILAVCLAALTLFSFASCGGETETESANAGVNTEETDMQTEASTSMLEDSETMTEKATEKETETETEVVYGSAVNTPENGSVITLANDEVYEWWSTFHFKKTDSNPYYRHEDIYYPNVVTFSWEENEEADYYTLYLSTDAGFAEEKTESYLVNANSLSLGHLYTGTKYYWCVYSTKIVDGEQVNTIEVGDHSFTTKESPRCLEIEGVSNTRDIGGLAAVEGYRIKQGMIYRGGKLEGMTEAGKAFFRDYLGIRTDLDLRTPGEGGAGTVSPLGEDINYVNIDGRYYTGSKGISNDLGKELFAQEIRLFADPDNYPFYIHCSLGRDRTGTLAFVIEALLGVSRNDLMMDYELSVFSVTGTLDNASVSAIRGNIQATYDYINGYYTGKNLAEKTENYLLSIGITAEEIQTIRDLLLEEVK